MARAALGWSVVETSKQANVSTQTIVRLERGDTLKETTVKNIREAFEVAGIEFISENGGGAGVRLSRRDPSDN